MDDNIFIGRVDYLTISDFLHKTIDNDVIKNKTIIIKPNVRSCHTPKKAKNTNPQTLDYVLRFLIDNFNNPIIVADSSIIGVDTKEAATIAGIKPVCDKYHVPFFDIRDYGYRRIEIPIEPNYIEISELFYLNNYVINMPKLKSTYAFPLSLTAKNLKGIISDRSKLDFHTYGVQERVALLNTLVHSDLSIIDGLYSLSLDTVLDTNLVFVSNNNLALDYFIATEMGYSEKDMLYLSNVEKKYSVLYSHNDVKSDFESISLNSVNPDDIRTKFGIEIIGTPCSACTGCIYKAIVKRKKNSYRTIYSGRFEKEAQIKGVFVGNCALKSLTKEYKNIIPGCPPQISEIIKILDKDD